MRWFSRSDVRSFHLLNATQFLGALNDNIYKLLVIFLLIDVKGAAASPRILSIAGAIYVIPFLLFSSAAGVLADRMSKTKIIVSTKIMEVSIMFYGLFATGFGWEVGSYIALFLMGAQSAFFGPSKYGIIPELVDEKKISKANSALASFTYLSIIFGTFLASFLTDISNKHFIFVSGFCLLVALVGLGTSLGIKKTEAQLSLKKINPLFLYEIYQTLRVCWKIPYLIPAIFGSAFFLFIGAYTQLNIIPLAMQSLHLTDIGGGYLFLATAIGIATGAFLAGRISKDKVELGLSAIASWFIALFFLSLYLFSFSLTATIINLILLGICGGCFLIPCDSFIQTFSPSQVRGQVIASANFLSFFGVLVAAFVLYFFSDILGLQASTGFALVGALTFVASFFILGRLSCLFLPFLAQKILHRFGQLHLLSPLPPSSNLIIVESSSWLPILLLYGFTEKLKVLFPDHYFIRFPWFNGWFSAFLFVSADPDEIASKLRDYLNKEERAIFFLRKKKEGISELKKYQTLFSESHLPFVIAELTEKKVENRLLFFKFQKKELSLTFPQ